MTHPREPEPLRPMLKTAESELVDLMDEACEHEVLGESTAELMRLEEALTDAARAAKQAVSLRRRLRTGHGGAEPNHSDDLSERAPASEMGRPATERRAQPDDRAGQTTADDEIAVREFLDRNGATWRVWSVTQEQIHSERVLASRMGEYRGGWLAFERTDGQERRRLPNYPANWRRLSNLELEGLLDRAESVRRRRSAGEDSETTLL